MHNEEMPYRPIAENLEAFTQSGGAKLPEDSTHSFVFSPELRRWPKACFAYVLNWHLISAFRELIFRRNQISYENTI